MQTIPYGSHPDQVGDCHLASAPHAPLICLFHGGFWRMPYGRDQLDPMARALAALGYSAWNIGYRRVGPGGSPWPATLDDVRNAVAFLPQLQQQHPALSLRRVIFIGHSAGGHLAFWAAAEASRRRLPYRPAGVVGLAPVLDLAAAYRTHLGDGAVADFLGGSPEEVPARYAAATPSAADAHGVPQWILHGQLDTAVPPAMSRAYVAAAHDAGTSITYEELREVDHMALIDPGSAAFPTLQACLGRLAAACS
jgi:acetyl esterase/lipase